MKRFQRAFTLLELLVAVVITLGLAGILLAVASSSLEHWRKAQGRVDSMTQAKIIFDLLERDIQGLLHRRDNNVWLAVDVIRDAGTAGSHGWFAGTAKPSGIASERFVSSDAAPSISNARFGLGGCWLRFFTTKQDTNASGRDLSAPSAVSYLILRNRVGSDSAEIRYRLFRADVRQTSTAAGRDGTFQAGYSLISPAYNTGSNTQADVGTVYTPVSADVLADNIADFGIWFYRRDSSGSLTRMYPQTSTDAQFRAPAGGEMPVAADVMVRILTQDGARLINAIENGRIQRPPGLTAGEWWWTVVEANSDVFTRRILIRGVAL